MRNGNPAVRFEEEVQELIDHGAETGILSPGEGEMIQSIVELGDTVAREIMVPRTSMVAVSANATLGEVLDLVIQNGHSRLPVFDIDVDHVIGIIHAKDLLSFWGFPPDSPLPRDIIRTPILVPDTKKIVDLLAEVRTKKSHMVILLDEYGGTAGLVTLEDIIEEIVGDIHDEYDIEEEFIKRLDDLASLVDARLNIEELEDFLNIDFPEGEYETVGGFLTALIGRVPQEGEKVAYKDLQFIIRSADERKINEVEIRPLDVTADSGDSD